MFISSKPEMFQLVCTLLVGVATMLRVIGWNLLNFVVDALIYSAHVRDPDAIIAHAGYYGQAVKEISSCLGVFIVPIVLNYVRPKWALVIGTSMFAFYIASFFAISNYLYFFSSVVFGFATTLLYAAFFTYQMQYSTRKTLARNTALVGGFLYMYITSRIDLDDATESAQYRYYSEAETRWLCGCLFACCALAIILHCFYPSKEASAMAAVLIHPHIILFLPRFVSHGLFLSFFMNVYPTTLHYSSTLATAYPMLTAYYAFAMCAGTTVCGFVIAPLNRRFHDFGLRPLYYLTVGVQLTAYVIATLTVPNWSTARPTAEGAIVEPNLGWVCAVGFLLGFADSTNTSSSTVLCSRLIHGRAAHTFSAARFYIGITCSIIFFCSPLLSMRMHASILISSAVISAVTFNFAVRYVEKANIEKSRTSSTTTIPTLVSQISCTLSEYNVFAER